MNSFGDWKRNPFLCLLIEFFSSLDFSNIYLNRISVDMKSILKAMNRMLRSVCGLNEKKNWTFLWILVIKNIFLFIQMKANIARRAKQWPLLAEFNWKFIFADRRSTERSIQATQQILKADNLIQTLTQT